MLNLPFKAHNGASDSNSECSPKKKIKTCHHYPDIIPCKMLNESDADYTLRVEQLARLAHRVGRRVVSAAAREPRFTFITDLGGSLKVGLDDHLRLFQ